MTGRLGGSEQSRQADVDTMPALHHKRTPGGRAEKGTLLGGAAPSGAGDGGRGGAMWQPHAITGVLVAGRGTQVAYECALERIVSRLARGSDHRPLHIFK